MILYTAGPMSGLPEFNYPAFFQTELQLEQAGYGVRNPARIDEVHERSQRLVPCPACSTKTPHDWAWYMKRAVAMLCEADGVATLSGWEKSRGARIEVELAADVMGMQVASVETWIARRKTLQNA